MNHKKKNQVHYRMSVFFLIVGVNILFVLQIYSLINDLNFK